MKNSTSSKGSTFSTWTSLTYPSRYSSPEDSRFSARSEGCAFSARSEGPAFSTRSEGPAFPTHQKPLTNHAIVLDLDETLVHTFSEFDKAQEYQIFAQPELRQRCYYIELQDVGYPKGFGEKTHYWGVTRPHVREFLEFCFSYFRVVGIWSAGKKEYVEAVVEFLFRDLSPPHFVFTYDDLHQEGTEYYKPLQKIFDETNLSSYVKPNQVFCLDDRDDVLSYNLENALIIPAYEPESLEEIIEDDPSLRQLTLWFLQPEVRQSQSVARLRKNIFS